MRNTKNQNKYLFYSLIISMRCIRSKCVVQVIDVQYIYIDYYRNSNRVWFITFKYVRSQQVIMRYEVGLLTTIIDTLFRMKEIVIG